MAHFAELDSNNVVLRVIKIANEVLIPELASTPNAEEEVLGQAFCVNYLGYSENGVKWIQTSYNGNFRNKYAGIGDTYDETRDAFLIPKPADSWTLNEDTLSWDPPVAHPGNPDDQSYIWVWDDENDNWTKLYPTE